MQMFNLNNNILVQINRTGWTHLQSTVGQEYINHCILPYCKNIDGLEWYSLQAHQVMELFGNSMMGCSMGISSNILIP